LIDKLIVQKYLRLSIALIAAMTVNIRSVDAQVIRMPDKKEKQTDTVRMAMDSSEMNRQSSFRDPIKYSAKDSMIYIFNDADTTIHLYKEGKVKSLDMSIDAGYIEASKRDGTIFGQGITDTADKQTEKPVFRDGNDEPIEMEALVYKFSTKKARIINISTKQGDGLLYGDIAKRTPDNTTFIKGARYTTCDDPHPHFYIRMTRGKVVDKPKRYIYFGPSYLVIEDVPFPLVIPFGFFPQQSGRSSGIRIPTYGEEVSRGFFLRDFGYYMAIGEHFDLDLKGDYYTLGSWAARAMSRYTKRYKFDGSFNLSYAFNATGDKGSPDYRAATTFAVNWRHQQSPKARPGTSFSANVNFASANNNLYNNNAAHDPYQNINNSINSSITYARAWQDSPFNLSFNASHYQNMRDSTYSVTFPNITLTMSRLYPFARKEHVGKKALYEDISFSYNMRFDNRVNFKSTELSNPGFTKKFHNGMSHGMAIGLPNFQLLKYLNLSPTVNYSTNWFFKSVEKHWDGENKRIVTDTAALFSRFGAVHDYSFAASLNTQIYGIVNFRKGGLVEAVRHVMKPSVTFSYSPDLRKAFNGYRTVQSDTLGNTTEYNIYEGQAYSVPSQPESGTISFSLGNNLEMKVRSGNDSVGIKKIPILNTFNINTSYNLLADSMNLANITFGGTTNLPGNTALTFGFTLDPYDIDKYGRKINTFYWKNHRGLNIGRLTSFNLSFGYSFSGGKGEKGEKDGKGKPKPNTDNNKRDMHGNDTHAHDHAADPVFNPFVYEPFSVPWSFSFNYSYIYNKSYNYSNQQLYTKHNHNQTLGFNASLSPTPNWDFRLNSGFDFRTMDITMTQISINRKLHCFSFSFNWTPLGSYQSWSFKIGILSSMLSDVIKYDKQSSYWDRQ
jgi:hypothetical protein